jgi:hypothetical protein
MPLLLLLWLCSDFKKGAEECGDGVCDDMILQSEGPMYWAPNAFLKGLPSLSGSGDLPLSGMYKRFMAANAGKVGTGQWDALLQTVSDAYIKMLPGSKSPSGLKRRAKLENTNNRGEHSFIMGAALVTAGPVSVFSKHTNLKYKEGFLHATPLVVPWGRWSEVDIISTGCLYDWDVICKHVCRCPRCSQHCKDSYPRQQYLLNIVPGDCLHTCRTCWLQWYVHDLFACCHAVTAGTEVETTPTPNSLVVDPFRYDLKLKRGGAY